ncbi:hypothetical protein HF086_006244 [Spodoptera exigua]|uniref:G-protein coupled receptors family 1 profile domain-containing protein n=1 Tax=Spodoptera exigua TaxID=7107 RepID=A0A922MHC1_SPOEX|nr:hypothetical protein HF086_006244 [Spodoptera exigua]
MLVCPAMVSIFSVGLIAVDRYIYILHGLYYQRWFNTTRVRIGILCIWMIGITLGFMPATGWTNTELIVTRCYYVSLFPGTLILINSFLSIVPIMVVIVLYTIILIKALKTVNVLNKSAKNSKAYRENMNFRISRGKANNIPISQPIEVIENKSTPKLTKSASYNNNVYGSGDGIITKPTLTTKSQSNHELGRTQTMSANNFENIGNRSKSQSESMFSICTIQSQGSNLDVSMPNLKPSRFQNQVRKICNVNALSRKPKEPNKWRAITIVMLTSGSFVITWMPFFICVTVFVFCEDKLTNPRCMYIRTLLGGPLATLAFLNSILNPLIYAWWHKGFQESVKNYYRVFVLNCICKISR